MIKTRSRRRKLKKKTEGGGWGEDVWGCSRSKQERMRKEKQRSSIIINDDDSSIGKRWVFFCPSISENVCAGATCCASSNSGGSVRGVWKHADVLVMANSSRRKEIFSWCFRCSARGADAEHATVRRHRSNKRSIPISFVAELVAGERERRSECQ